MRFRHGLCDSPSLEPPLCLKGAAVRGPFRSLHSGRAGDGETSSGKRRPRENGPSCSQPRRALNCRPMFAVAPQALALQSPPPHLSTMFSMAAASLGQAVMTECSVAGMEDATGRPPLR